MIFVSVLSSIYTGASRELLDAAEVGYALLIAFEEGVLQIVECSESFASRLEVDKEAAAGLHLDSLVAEEDKEHFAYLQVSR